ncbi:MAG: DUF4388 domain-containing protein [Myxococcota bacterium]|nr:DUF4388 domain-containing protein [Myxococcota bacterium]
MAKIESIRLGGDYKGRFGEYPLPDLLLGLLRGNLTGLLEIQLDPSKKNQVYFKNGVPVSVMLPSLVVSLSEILRDRGELEQAIMESVRMQASNTSTTESAVLSSNSSVLPGTLQRGMRIRARAELVRLFDVGDKFFRFQEGAEIPADAEITILQPLPIIYEGLLSSKDRRHVQHFLNRTRGRRFVRLDTYPIGVNAFEWSDQVESVVAALSTPRSIDELTKSGLPVDHLAVVLTTLSMTGMVEDVSPEVLSRAPSSLPERQVSLPHRPLKLKSSRNYSTADPALESVSKAAVRLPEQDSSVEKAKPLLGKNFYEILRITPSSSDEQIQRAVKFFSKNSTSEKLYERIVAALAKQASRILMDSNKSSEYRQAVMESKEMPKAMQQRIQFEIGSKLEAAFEAILHARTVEADFWLTWAAALDPSRADLRVHRAFVSFQAASGEKKSHVANALREFLAEEVAKHPAAHIFQIYLAAVVASLGEAELVANIRGRRGVAEHAMISLIDRYTK